MTHSDGSTSRAPGLGRSRGYIITNDVAVFRDSAVDRGFPRALPAGCVTFFGIIYPGMENMPLPARMRPAAAEGSARSGRRRFPFKQAVLRVGDQHTRRSRRFCNRSLAAGMIVTPPAAPPSTPIALLASSPLLLPRTIPRCPGLGAPALDTRPRPKQGFS
jgi:hypothetical protein